jgi:hypothetical protein
MFLFFYSLRFFVFLTKCCSLMPLFFFYAFFPTHSLFLFLFRLLSLFPILLFLFEFLFTICTPTSSFCHFFSSGYLSYFHFHLLVIIYCIRDQRYPFFASRVTSKIIRHHFLMLYKQPIQIVQYSFTSLTVSLGLNSVVRKI